MGSQGLWRRLMSLLAQFRSQGDAAPALPKSEGGLTGWEAEVRDVRERLDRAADALDEQTRKRRDR